MKKIYIIPMFAILFLGVVFAVGYVVNNFSAQVDIAEPFDVSYAILGDAGTPAWQVASCDLVTPEAYVDLSGETQPVDFSYIYAGENRTFCAKINNVAEVPLGYIVSAEVRTGLGNYEDCVAAFGDLTSVTGDVDAFSSIYANKLLQVSAEAPVIEDCIIDVSVARTGASA